MRRNSTKPPGAARAFPRYRKTAQPSGDHLSQKRAAASFALRTAAKLRELLAGALSVPFESEPKLIPVLTRFRHANR
jgi:hypothetical protein